MNYYPTFQTIQQQQQANHFLRCQTKIAKSEQLVCTTEKVITPSLEQLDTVALVQYGGPAAAIILAIALLILALSEYNKVFVLLVLQKQKLKTK
jgi:hypothetical protein